MIITLIGFMGSGKTFIGNKLALSLNFPFIDLDYYISKKNKLSINDIFSNYGEKYFRQKENEALQELLNSNNFILSPGGGIVELPKNRLLLKETKFLNIFLNPDWNIIFSRIYQSKRPLVKKLTENDLFSLYKKRLGYYQDLAQITINSNNPEIIISQILQSDLICKP